MAQLISDYRGCKVRIVREGKRNAWRYTVEPPSRRQPSLVVLPGKLMDVGPFDSSDAAYQDAVRRITILTAAPWDHAV